MPGDFPTSTQRTRTITITRPFGVHSSSASVAALSSGSRVRRTTDACVVSSLPPSRLTTSAECTLTSTTSPPPSRPALPTRSMLPATLPSNSTYLTIPPAPPWTSSVASLLVTTSILSVTLPMPSRSSTPGGLKMRWAAKALPLSPCSS